MTMNKTGIELLEHVLDVYGADRTRWPARVRLELTQLEQVSPQARRMIADAAAFERLLAHAPVVPQARVAALAERISAQAARTPRMASTRPAGALRVEAPRRARWPLQASGAAALAASLLIGILAGQSQTLAPTVTELASAVGLETVSDIQQIAHTDEAVGLDEDLL